MSTITIMSSYELHLTYLTARARGEPVLLLLVDSGIPFTLEEVPPETWGRWRTSGKVTRDLYPYSALPVLRVRDKSGRGDDFVLAETSAILEFLEEFLAPQGTPVGDGDSIDTRGRLTWRQLLKDMCLEVRASARMIKEASLFFLGRVWETTVNKVAYHPKQLRRSFRLHCIDLGLVSIT